MAQAAYNSRRLDLQLQEIDRTLEDLRRQLALAKRAGDTARATELQSQIDAATAQRTALLDEWRRAQQEQTLLGKLSKDDPNLAMRLWEADVKQFRDAGLWVPSFVEWLDFMTGGGTPAQWPQFVRDYDARMRQLLGAPKGEDLPKWMDPDVQRAYENDRQNYYAKYPVYRVGQAPEFPPAVVYWANFASPEPLSLDELVQRWNDHKAGLPVELPGVPRPKAPAPGPAGTQRPAATPAPTAPTAQAAPPAADPVEVAARTIVQVAGSADQALRDFSGFSEAQRQQLLQAYRLPPDAWGRLIEAIRRLRG